MIAHNGVFQAVRGVLFRDITDGLTNTLLIGEKHIPQAAMWTDLPGPDGRTPLDCSLFDGHVPNCFTRGAGHLFPLAWSDDDYGWKFGSRHPGLCQFVFCDGSVRALSVSVHPTVLGLLAQRNDGQPVVDY